jgi:H+/Cl- antiporter ClcA
VLLAAAVGIGVGLRSPLTGTLLVPEMTGDLRLVPATAGVVAVAFVLDRGLDRVARLLGQRLPTALRDEDA